MPSEYYFRWYCGWCGFGPHSSLSDFACCECHRRRDEHFRVEDIIFPYQRSYHEAGPNPESNQHPEHPGARSVLATNTESVRSRAASKSEGSSPAKLSVNRSPANSVSSKDSNAAIDAGNGDSGLAPNALIPPTVSSSWEQKTASQDDPATRKDAGGNLNKNNVSQTGSVDKQSRLNDYLSVNPEDPWNQEWVVYAARTPLPGEASYLLETGEPATTPRRRRYDRRRRAEVAFTRNNGGACGRCRRRHRACPHRLQERVQELAAAIGGDETASEQLGERGVTQPATDAVRSGMAASIRSNSQHSEATSQESSARGRLSFPTPRREPSQRPPAHGRPSARPPEHLTLAPSQSRRRQASHSSPALVDELGIRPGRLLVHDGSNFLRPPPARRSPWDGHGINAVSGSSGSSRHPDYITIRDTSRDSAASTPIAERYSLGSTQRGTEELSYRSDGVGLRSFTPLPYNEQQSLLSEQMFATRPDTFDPASNQRTTLPDEGFTWNVDGYANLGNTRARSSNVTDPPRSSSRNHVDPIPVGIVDESSSPVIRPSETPFWPSQLANSTMPTRDSLLPQTTLDDESMSVLEDQQAIPNFSDEILGWQIEDGSLLDAGLPEQTFDTALLDELPAAPDQGGDHDTTQFPSAIDADSQPVGSDEWIDTDLAADFAWDNLYYGGVDPTVDPPLGSYAANLGNPFSTDGQENTSWSNSDPITTPPSD